MRFKIEAVYWDGEEASIIKNLASTIEANGAFQALSGNIITQTFGYYGNNKIPPKLITREIDVKEESGRVIITTETIDNPDRIEWEKDFFSNGTDHKIDGNRYASRKIEDPVMHWYFEPVDLEDLARFCDAVIAQKVTFDPETIVIEV